MSSPRLGEILVSEKIVSLEVVERALAVQKRSSRRRLGDILLESGALEPAWLTAALAMQAGVATVDPLALKVDAATLWRVPLDVAQREGSFVARDADGLLVVVQDPSNPRVARAFAALLGVPTVRVAAGLPDRVAAAIARHYDVAPVAARRTRGLTGEERPALTSPTSGELDSRAMLARLHRQTPRSLADFATALLVFAVETGAERLTIDAGKVSITWDGVERYLLELTAAHAYGVANRLRVITHLDPGASRPGSVDAAVTLGTNSVEVAARSQPGPSGGRVDLRLVEADATTRAGMHPKVASTWRTLLAAPGLVIVATPEGTQVSSLPETPSRVERRALTDRESVDAAVRAVEAGRTVLGTVSAPGIADALARLRDLAPSRSALATALTGALAARRLRQVCTACAQPAEVDHAGAERLGVVPFAAPRPGGGCPECGYRRYRGSVWCYEVTVASQALRDAVDTGASLSEIASRCTPVASRAMQVDAVAHAILGLTSSEELARAIPPRPAWAAVTTDARSRGLLRAVTDADAEPVDDPKSRTSASDLPTVLLVHPGDVAATALRASLAGRARVTGAWSAAEARAPTKAGVPAVGVLARAGRVGWDAALIRDLQALGMRIVLLGPPGDLAEMAIAFGLGADEYAGSVEELAVRLPRWLPRVEEMVLPRCNFG